MEQFDESPLNYHYFMALLVEVVETKIGEPRRRLTQLIKFTTKKAIELIRKRIVEVGECIRKPGLECTGYPRNVMFANFKVAWRICG